MNIPKAMDKITYLENKVKELLARNDALSETIKMKNTINKSLADNYNDLKLRISNMPVNNT